MRYEKIRNQPTISNITISRLRTIAILLHSPFKFTNLFSIKLSLPNTRIEYDALSELYAYTVVNILYVMESFALSNRLLLRIHM